MFQLHCGVHVVLRQYSVSIALWCSHDLKAIQCFTCTGVHVILRQYSVSLALWCSHGLKAVQCFSCTVVFT